MSEVSEPPRLNADVAKLIVPIYEREYKELCDNWSSLERKAQLAGGVAGAVLTGGLAVLGNERFTLPSQLIFATPIVGAFVFIALVCSLRALWVSSETLPPAGDDIRKLAWELKDATPSTFEVESLHIQLIHWDTACRDLLKSINRKAGWVTAAQRWLLVTAMGLLLLIAGIGYYK